MLFRSGSRQGAKEANAQAYSGGRGSGKGAARDADDGAVCAGGLSGTEAAAARLNPLGGVSRKPGGLPLFSPEGRRGRTCSPPAKAGGGSPPVGRARALSEGDCGTCGSRQTMPQHLLALLSSSARLGKPATGSFVAEMDGRSARPFSLLRKRNRKKKTR